ncbi:MAG: methyltransferase domain-containing protein, partial [Pyrinomonadaceae bacterium]|nr:methyltransferase domain-containing protein [Pyrinomonadaceae bacterium]
VLHIAPEPCFIERLRSRLTGRYLTADLQDEAAMVKLDITDIQFAAETFDVIYCSHVLEHVLDDRQALSELYRVLKTGGWAILNVPIVGEKTFEDSSVVEPLERLRLFGETDHVRVYGRDYLDRLKEAGFETSIVMPTDFLDVEEIGRMGITDAAGEIFYCAKATTSTTA